MDLGLGFGAVEGRWTKKGKDDNDTCARTEGATSL